MNSHQKKRHCDLLLEAMVGKALILQWWNTPNKAFAGRHPANVDIDAVHSYLLNHAYNGDYH